jgi:hypothetical protein
MLACREIANRRSIFPLQPMGAPPPKSGMAPRSRDGSACVSASLLPELVSPVVVVVVPVLPELEDELPDDSSGTIVATGAVVNADESEAGA